MDNNCVIFKIYIRIYIALRMYTGNNYLIIIRTQSKLLSIIEIIVDNNKPI